MPPTFTALAVLLAAAAPGYAFVRIVEVKVPRRRRSSAMEVVDLVCVGAAGSVVAVLAVLVLARHWTALLPLDGLLRGAVYLRPHAWQAIWSAILALAVSVGLSAAAGLAETWRRRSATRSTSASAFHRVAESTPAGHHPFLAVHLTDGRVWEGFLKGMDDDRGSLAEGDLVLQGPLALTVPGQRRLRHPAGFVVLPGSQIVLAYGTYLRPEPRLSPPDATPSPGTAVGGAPPTTTGPTPAPPPPRPPVSPVSPEARS
ncbi:DUF6338 family protein [Streptomyces sp. H27-G5]|uniref:DUF6338 family protein n=1 Tax=Streptomyces sp. H27-G5 TaxID=2996698 RepID=UPI00226F3C87|nr:DUF6338 family protein [Streptomyces sp. H27-G5]MCY0919738.1 DUF6338 family protein [Streptomyces sp. H27-G5]